MISPIQLSDYALHELHFAENTDYEPVYGEPFTLRLYANGTLLEERTGDAADPEDLSVPLDLDVSTSLYPLDPPEGAPHGYRFFDAFLTVQINGTAETMARSPYWVILTCSGTITADAYPDDPDAQPAALRVLRANSASILYGMARQTFLTLTQGSRTLNLLLPSLSFREIVDAEIDQEAEPAPD